MEKKDGYLYYSYSGGKFTLEGENEGFRILCHEKFTDIDGTLLGIALAKSSTQYATWFYSYFPGSKFFTGFNCGHYNKGELPARADYYKRLCDMSERIIRNKERAEYRDDEEYEAAE